MEWQIKATRIRIENTKHKKLANRPTSTRLKLDSFPRQEVGAKRKPIQQYENRALFMKTNIIKKHNYN